MTKPDEWELQEERDKRMRSEYHHPIERLSEKVDQLQEVITQPSKKALFFYKKIIIKIMSSAQTKIIELNEVLQEETIVLPKLTCRRRSINLKSDFEI